MILANLPRPFYVLAPMYEVTDTVFRQIIASLHPPDLFFTEFVNVDGLQSPGRRDLSKRLRYTAAEQPLIAQIWGIEPRNYEQTARELVDLGFAGVDINMGCPDRSIVKNGCCSGLIAHRDHAVEIIKAVQRGTEGRVPISVKTRLGLREVDFTWHELLLQQNLAMLTIHGRTAKQMSQGDADWQAIGHVRELRDQLAPQTLIVGNGDVVSRSQGDRLAVEQQLDGIMVGRGIFQDPLLFAHRSNWTAWTPEQRIDLYRRHVELFAATWQYGERPLPTLNKFCKVYINGFEGSKELRERLMPAKSTNELLAILAAAL